MSQRKRVVSNAIGDIGYREGPNNDTKFGTWYGLPNQPWCAMAVSKWFHDAGIGQDIMPRFASCTAGYNTFKKMGRVRTRGYYPQAGDICFIVWTEGEATPDHVGIVEKCEGGVVHTIEGNRDNMVKRSAYPVNDWRIYGYAVPDFKENEEKKEEEEDMHGCVSNTKLIVYQTSECKDAIGSIAAGELFAGKEIFAGIYIAMYSLDGTDNKVKKCGFVEFKE